MINANNGAQQSNRDVPPEAQERCSSRSQPYASRMEVCFPASSRVKMWSLEGRQGRCVWVRVWFTTAAGGGSTRAEWSPCQRGTAVAIWNRSNLREQSVHVNHACTLALSAGLSGSASAEVIVSWPYFPTFPEIPSSVSVVFTCVRLWRCIAAETSITVIRTIFQDTLDSLVYPRWWMTSKCEQLNHP